MNLKLHYKTGQFVFRTTSRLHWTALLPPCLQRAYPPFPFKVFANKDELVKSPNTF